METTTPCHGKRGRPETLLSRFLTSHMRLNLNLLQNPRLQGGKLIARCPACAEAGDDRRCEHLVVFDAGTGPYRCIVDPDGAGSEHSKRIHKLVGLDDDIGAYFQAKRDNAAKSQRPADAMDRPLPRVPPMRRLTLGEVADLALQRGWAYFVGFELLSRRGLLHYGDVHDNGRAFPSWIIADSSCRNIQARRLDGKPWDGIGGAKAKSLFGSQASWPIGAADIGDRPIVALTEGGPDFCCALLIAWFEGVPVDTVAPVTMTGAGNSIHTDAIPLFRGKRVRIIEHRDAAGIEAGKRWSEQLWRAGAAQVDGFRFDKIKMNDGAPAKDLADFARLLDDESPPLGQILADLVCDHRLDTNAP